jgi:hypothetical protein
MQEENRLHVRRKYRQWLLEMLIDIFRSRNNSGGANFGLSVYLLYVNAADVSVGIAMGYGLNGPGLIPDTASRPTLGPTQFRIQWVPWKISPGVKRQGRETGNSPSSSVEVKNGGAIPPFPETFSWHRDSLFFALCECCIHGTWHEPRSIGCSGETALWYNRKRNHATVTWRNDPNPAACIGTEP